MDVNKFFDNINKSSLKKHKFFKVRELKETINSIQKECGSCKMWMTKQCPRESKIHKVSFGEFKCDKFLITEWTTRFVKRKEDEVKELSNPCD